MSYTSRKEGMSWYSSILEYHDFFLVLLIIKEGGGGEGRTCLDKVRYCFYLKVGAPLLVYRSGRGIPLLARFSDPDWILM